jgi:polynucleotide 5'-hydroxyl-kinase GRC3/NOL9
LVKGPILLKVTGECEILGVKFKDTFIPYNNNKYLPIEKDQNARITVKNDSKRFDIEYATGNQSKIGTSIWNNIIDSIVKTNRRKIIIIGPSDTGKSTLTLFIANKLINRGFQPLIIDSDIGQGELAPPTCIGAKILIKQTIDLSKDQPNRINFIGNIQPIGYELRIVNCIKGIYKKLNKNNNITIINTDGYIINDKRNYKIDLIEKINPDCIICMGENNHNVDFFHTIKIKFKKKPNIQILNGQSPNKQIQKSHFERREKRLNNYFSLFKNFTKEISISKENLNAIYYKNKFFILHKASYISRFNKIETKKISIDAILNDRIFIRDRFVGLSSKDDYENIAGFGIIKDYNNNFFRIQTSVAKFDHIYFSDIKLYFDKNTTP